MDHRQEAGKDRLQEPVKWLLAWAARYRWEIQALAGQVGKRQVAQIRRRWREMVPIWECRCQDRKLELSRISRMECQRILMRRIIKHLVRTWVYLLTRIIRLQRIMILQMAERLLITWDLKHLSRTAMMKVRLPVIWTLAW